MSRAMAFENLKNHPWHGRVFAKLKASDKELALKFIEENDRLLILDFEYRVNRMFLDKPAKPKNWTIICELLQAANFIAKSHLANPRVTQAPPLR